jgi:S1-C subfamily serine protease
MTIEKTLPATKKATVAIVIPKSQGFAFGTGFFVSRDGYLITARHVIFDRLTGKPYPLSSIGLEQPEELFSTIGKVASIAGDWPKFDLALLKVDFNKEMGALRGKTEPDFLQIDFEVAPEGVEVYSFGYPLPDIETLTKNEQVTAVGTVYCPRATSMVISSHRAFIKHARMHNILFPHYYVLDRALNKGNSGGPIVVTKSGKVISVCSQSQFIEESQLGVPVVLPAYAISSSLKNIEEDLVSII